MVGVKAVDLLEISNAIHDLHEASALILQRLGDVAAGILPSMFQRSSTSTTHARLAKIVAPIVKSELAMNQSNLTRFAASVLLIGSSFLSLTAAPDSSGLPPAAARHWTADNGNGTYSNPLFYEEFEDPDIIRVGEGY